VELLILYCSFSAAISKLYSRVRLHLPAFTYHVINMRNARATTATKHELFFPLFSFNIPAFYTATGSTE
jgi:hypothetical protein